jgi:S1-C subfamily serine protease
MSSSVLAAISNEMADTVAAVAPAVVQVQSGRRPASGLVYADDVVLTTGRALGRGDGLRVRRHDGQTLEAELTGWDPPTGLAVLRVGGLGIAPIAASPDAARVGHFALAVARSWSNAVTASAGIVSVIGGPLPTGFRRAIDEVIRTTAPMHDGFAGGAFVDTSGRLIGVPTAAEIRGLGVVIPARIAWARAAALLQHGAVKRGYLGLAGQAARLPETQRGQEGRDRALLVVGVTPASPAADAGLLVGDLLLEFDGHVVGSAEDLLELLTAERIGHSVPLRVQRGGTQVNLTIAVGERPSRRRS